MAIRYTSFWQPIRCGLSLALPPGVLSVSPRAFLVPTGVGIFQVRATEPELATAEWDFAIGAPFWGTGTFINAARSIVEFAFETIGVHRLEARAAVENARSSQSKAVWGSIVH
jgi:hypothetical protein